MYIGQIWRNNTKKRSLDIHCLIKRQVLAMHHDGSAGVFVQLAKPADVIDVRVGADDRFDGELMASQEVQNAADLIAGIDHQRFARDRIPDNRAVALQHPHGNRDVDEALLFHADCWCQLVHLPKYNIHASDSNIARKTRASAVCYTVSSGHSPPYRCKPIPPE